MSQPKRAIDAIYETELEDFLAQFGLLDDYHMGALRCVECARVITRDTLFGFVSAHGDLKAVCDRAECIEAAYRSGPGHSPQRAK